MFRQILVTTDGSPLGNLALPVAADLARTYKCALTLLYVVPDMFSQASTSGGEVYFFDQEVEEARLSEEADRILAACKTLLDYEPALLVSTRQRGQEVADVIAEEVELRRADLIVMSTHGRRGLAHLFLGSVAEGVLRKVRIPVFLVRSPESPPVAGQEQVQENTTA